jgi:uncharacterized protein YutE (UPF0331/DUF86 family)
VNASRSEMERQERELALLRQAGEITRRSFERCSRIGVKDDYDGDELNAFEAFASRFGRVADILVQRVLRLIERIDLDDPGTVRDRINRAEKKGLIENAQTFAEIRTLRNAIAHEYLPEAIRIIFRQTLRYAPTLLDAVERSLAYARRYDSGDNPG